METLKERWYGLTVREQKTLITLGFATVIFAVYMFLVLPLFNMKIEQQRRLQSSLDELAQVRQLVAQVEAQEENGSSSPNRGSQNLSVLIDSSLRENGLQMRGFQPGSAGDARLRLENAAYPDLMQWLYDIEYKHQVVVQELSLAPATVSGRLMVNMRVSKAE